MHLQRAELLPENLAASFGTNFPRFNHRPPMASRLHPIDILITADAEIVKSLTIGRLYNRSVCCSNMNVMGNLPL